MTKSGKIGGPIRGYQEDAMEDKELSFENVDKQREAIMDIGEQPQQDYFIESDPTLYMSNWHNLPDLVFDAIMMMVSLPDLCKCLQVCRSWKEKIIQNILENRTKKNIIGARMERALGPGFEFPSGEEIRNAKWLCKYNLSLIFIKNCLF